MSSALAPTIPGATARLSKKKGISTVCGAPNLPPATGEGQSISYTQVRCCAGLSARRSASITCPGHERNAVVAAKKTSAGEYCGYHARYFATMVSGFTGPRKLPTFFSSADGSSSQVSEKSAG